VLAALVCAIAQAPQTPQPMPKVEGDSFTGQHVVLPAAAKGKVAVLVFGFTKASKGPTSIWAQKTLAEFGSNAGFELYQLPVLEDVPRLIRGMVISGIKKGVPQKTHDHFVPIVQGEAELKKFVNYKEPDDAYLVILDATGQVVQQLHGMFSDAAFAQLRAEVQSLLGHTN
jgi:hypothetical protein